MSLPPVYVQEYVRKHTWGDRQVLARFPWKDQSQILGKEPTQIQCLMTNSDRGPRHAINKSECIFQKAVMEAQVSKPGICKTCICHVVEAHRSGNVIALSIPHHKVAVDGRIDGEHKLATFGLQTWAGHGS